MGANDGMGTEMRESEAGGQSRGLFFMGMAVFLRKTGPVNVRVKIKEFEKLFESPAGQINNQPG